MIVHYHHMTGDELQRIYKISGLKADDFASKIGLERHQLYTQIGRQGKAIDMEVEAAIKDVPDLARHSLLVVKQQQMESKGEGSEVVKFLTDTIQVLKDVLVKTDKQTAVMQKAVDSLADSNKHIREEADLYRRMIADGYDAGLLKWNPKK